MLEQLNQDFKEGVCRWVCSEVQIPIEIDEQMRLPESHSSDPNELRIKSNCFETDGCNDLQRSKIKEPVSDICKFFAAADADHHVQLKSLLELPLSCSPPLKTPS